MLPNSPSDTYTHSLLSLDTCTFPSFLRFDFYSSPVRINYRLLLLSRSHLFYPYTTPYREFFCKYRIMFDFPRSTLTVFESRGNDANELLKHRFAQSSSISQLWNLVASCSAAVIE